MHGCFLPSNLNYIVHRQMRGGIITVEGEQISSPHVHMLFLIAAMASCTVTYSKQRTHGGPPCPRPPVRYPEPCAAFCASFELLNIQVKTGKYIYVLCVRNQHWWMTWPVELWWSGDRAPLTNRLQGFTPLCAINKRCSSSLFPCHR